MTKTMTTELSDTITIELACLERVTGAGAKDSEYCKATRAAGMKFGDLAAGGQVAEQVGPKLFPKGAPDGFMGSVANKIAGTLGDYPSPVVAEGIDGKLPAFCK